MAGSSKIMMDIIKVLHVVRAPKLKDVCQLMKCIDQYCPKELVSCTALFIMGVVGTIVIRAIDESLN